MSAVDLDLVPRLHEPRISRWAADEPTETQLHDLPSLSSTQVEQEASIGLSGTLVLFPRGEMRDGLYFAACSRAVCEGCIQGSSPMPLMRKNQS